MKTKRVPGGKRRTIPVLPPIVPTQPYTQREAADLLRIGRDRVAEECGAGRLPARRDGKTVYYLGEDLLAWLKKRGSDA